MKGYIDIHNHILPQLDDGSKSMEQTLEMLRIAYMDGIRTIIATPHYREGYYTNSVSVLEEQIAKVTKAMNSIVPDMEILLGTEIYYSHETVRLLKEKEIPTMAGSRYVLVEFSISSDFQYIKNGLQELLFEGYIPILAHAERYIYIRNDLNNIRELIETGIYFQINAMSIIGEMGRDCKKAARVLLKYNGVHFIATDSHSEFTRAPRIKKAIDYITKKYGDSYAEELLYKNPSKVVNNEYI